MIVFFTKDGHEIINYWHNPSELRTEGNNVWLGMRKFLHGVNWDKVEYREIVDQEIRQKVDDEENTIPTKLEELDLTNPKPTRDLVTEIDGLEGRIKTLEDKQVRRIEW